MCANTVRDLASARSPKGARADAAAEDDAGWPAAAAEAEAPAGAAWLLERLRRPASTWLSPGSAAELTAAGAAATSAPPASAPP
jgi:hypothetical protein